MSALAGNAAESAKSPVWTFKNPNTKERSVRDNVCACLYSKTQNTKGSECVQCSGFDMLTQCVCVYYKSSLHHANFAFSFKHNITTWTSPGNAALWYEISNVCVLSISNPLASFKFRILIWVLFRYLNLLSYLLHYNVNISRKSGAVIGTPGDP
jgi:hypothetical protein